MCFILLNPYTSHVGYVYQPNFTDEKTEALGGLGKRSFPCHPGGHPGSWTDYSNQLMPEQGSEDAKLLLRVLSMMIKSEHGISCAGGVGRSHRERISDLLPD